MALGERLSSLAAQNGGADIIDILCAHGADSNKAPRWKSTPLHCAALVGCKEAIKTLCEHGANVNALNVLGEPALSFAAQGGYAEVIRTLCQHGADFNASSPATIALSIFKYHQVDAAAELLNIWFPNHLDEDGYSAPHYACDSSDMQTGHPDLVRLLLKQSRCDCDVQNTEHKTPLAWTLHVVDWLKKNVVSVLLEIFQMLLTAGGTMGQPAENPFSSLLSDFISALRFQDPPREQEIDSLCDCLKQLVMAGITPTEEDFDKMENATHPRLVQLLAATGVQEQAIFASSNRLSLQKSNVSASSSFAGQYTNL